MEAEAGQLITVNPGEVHDGAPLGRTARSWHMLYLTPALVSESMSDLISTTGDLEFEHPVFIDPSVRTLLETLHLHLGDQDGSEHAKSFREILVLLLGRTLTQPTSAPAPLPASLQRVRQRLDDDPASPAALEELARDAGLSRFQLIRAFLRHTGLTPHAYLMQRRALLSRSLLATGLAPAEVAAACGYVDQSHMHREFRRRFGLTPGAYRGARIGCNPVQDGQS